jgi:sugar phosphate isomerase/epimerase
LQVFVSHIRFYSIIPQKIGNLKQEVSQINSKVFEPTVEQRGLQLHILHPIEALFSFWIPSPEGEKEAFRIVKWIARQRGNYIQLTALDNIKKDEDYTGWKEHMKKILDYAHKIGVKVGINIQIFSISSFQRAYVVSTKQDLEKILSLPFDVVNISFGEFTGTTPDEFIQKVNEVYEWVKSFNKNIEKI